MFNLQFSCISIFILFKGLHSSIFMLLIIPYGHDYYGYILSQRPKEGLCVDSPAWRNVRFSISGKLACYM